MIQKLLFLLVAVPLCVAAQKNTSNKLALGVPGKGSVILKVAVPEGNLFLINKGNGYGTTAGFLGISGGCAYYFTNRFNVNIDIGGVTDFMVPFPAPVDHMGSYERTFAVYGDLQVGTDIKRLHIDAGLQYTKTIYYAREAVELFPNYTDTLKSSKRQGNAGLALSTYFRVTDWMSLGVNYYPSLIVFDNSRVKTHYGHLLFFEFIFPMVVHKSKGL